MLPKPHDPEFSALLDKISTYSCFIFNQVIRYDSVEAAAKILNISATKIHHEMNALERILEDPLILRNHQRVILTDSGKNFADFSRALVDAIECSGEKLHDRQDDLVIGCYYGFAESVLPEVIFEFTQLYPDVCMYIQSGIEYTDFTHNDLDVLIAYPLSDLSEFDSVHLMDDIQYLFASPDYITEHKKPITYDDFKNHKLLTFHGNTYYPKEIFEINKPFLSSTSMGLLYEMAKLGQGIAVLPKSRLQPDDLSEKKLVEIVKGMVCKRESISFMTRKFSNKKYLTNILFEIVVKKIRSEYEK